MKDSNGNEFLETDKNGCNPYEISKLAEKVYNSLKAELSCDTAYTVKLINGTVQGTKVDNTYNPYGYYKNVIKIAYSGMYYNTELKGSLEILFGENAPSHTHPLFNNNELVEVNIRLFPDSNNVLYKYLFSKTATVKNMLGEATFPTGTFILDDKELANSLAELFKKFLIYTFYEGLNKDREEAKEVIFSNSSLKRKIAGEC